MKTGVLVTVSFGLGIGLGCLAMALLGSPEGPGRTRESDRGPSPAAPTHSPAQASVRAAPVRSLPESSRDRAEALRDLQETPDRSRVPELLAALDAEKDAGLRVLACAALGECGDASILGDLLRRFRSESDFRVRYALLEAALRIGGPEVDALCRELVATPDDSRDGVLLGELAAGGLVARDTPEAAAFVESFLKAGVLPMGHDPDWTSRSHLLEKLSERGDAKSLALLAAVAGDGSLSVDLRAAALRALGDTKTEGRAAALASLLEAALASGDPAIVEDVDPRMEAVSALGARPEEPAAAKVLAGLLQGARVLPEELRRQSVRSLGNAGGPEDAALLLGIARDPAVPPATRKVALSSYGRVAGTAAVQALEEIAMGAAPMEERTAAVRAIGMTPPGPKRSALERIAAGSPDRRVAELARAYLR